jgi:putative peptidoglycan lipid II flippase
MRRLFRDVLLMALATGISRVFGLFRDVTIADRFGASGAYDAFLVAFFLPVFLRQLLAEGALSTAFIPVYTEALVTDDEAERFVNNVLSLLVILFPIVVALGILLAPYYLPFLASGFSPEKLALSIRLSRILFPFIALVGFAAVFMGILNAHHRFFVASLAPVLFNLGMIAGALLLAPRFSVEPIYGLALGALLGGAGQLLFQIPALRRVGFRFRFTLWPLHPGIRRMGRLMVPALFGLAVTQLNLLVDNKLASYLGDGGIASLQYAMRLFQLPLGVFAVSIATALLPRFSASLAAGERDRFSTQLADGISASAFVLLPAMAGLYAIGPNLIRLLFEHGSFSAADTLRTANALSFYLVGVLPYGFVYIFTRAFYAMGRTRIPLVASSCAVLTNIAFDLLLVGPMREGGLALSTSIAGIVNTIVLAFFLWREFPPKREEFVRWGKIVLGTGFVFIAAFATRRAVGGIWMPVFLPILAGVVCYLIYARVSGLWSLIKLRRGHLE